MRQLAFRKVTLPPVDRIDIRSELAAPEAKVRELREG
jgi:hypothetical protein